MSFDTNRFEQAQFQPRTLDVAVPELAAFYAEGETPIWRVRGLTAAELQIAAEAAKRRELADNALQAIAANAGQVAELRKIVGLANDMMPAEVVRRQEMLRMGSVTPGIDLTVAVKLCESFPIVFVQLTNQIAELTGQGAELVKPGAASQPTPVSSTE